jgi:membrane protein YqaA with SNARE-associated domain
LKAAREYRVMHPPATSAALLFAYAFLSNIALAFVPHEPAIIWYGPRLGVWTTTLVATAGTMLAAVVDHRMFAPLIARMARSSPPSSPLFASQRGGQGVRTWPEQLFRRFPFVTIALSGLTPLPFFPFKALAFATGCPAGKYTAAVAARCLPRYALLAWLGAAVQVPVWIMVALFALLMIPSLRMVWWRRAAS